MNISPACRHQQDTGSCLREHSVCERETGEKGWLRDTDRDRERQRERKGGQGRKTGERERHGEKD